MKNQNFFGTRIESRSFIIWTIFLVSTFHCFQAEAETVFVKYRGAIDLSTFHCTIIDSSLVNRICYQKQNNYLVVLLQNTYYHYCRISEETVHRWLEAKSKGKFYIEKVKGNFDCRLGGVPENAH